MGNLDLYNKVRVVPKEALKEIQAGRLKGKSDINPMWRIKELTEQFGPCGYGWKYEITKQWLENGGNGEIAAFCNINLYVHYNGLDWSEAIPGTGGSSFVANEKNGPYVSDECFKMALTDAISVACKALGFGADVYWNSDKSKYDSKGDNGQPQTENKPKNDSEHKCEDCGNVITATEKKSVAEIIEGSKKYYKKELCSKCVGVRYRASQKPA